METEGGSSPGCGAGGRRGLPLAPRENMGPVGAVGSTPDAVRGGCEGAARSYTDGRVPASSESGYF